MKKLLFILNLLLVTSAPLLAQEEGDDSEVGDKVRDKMSEYIQKRLLLSKDETEKFTPVFTKYFRDWVQAIKDNRGDKLVMQQKIVELRLRYRPQFIGIIGDKRGGLVFAHQDRFIQEIRQLRQERLRNGPNRPLKRRVNSVF
ncbi:MAG: hypothetical protein JNK14_18865 [Chitinophagaceae bacterium]|nr:hypothetical protein [Chitinophagaceae bacterium]